MSKRSFPLIPSKASEVEIGDFFSIPLRSGNFACGRILLIERKSGRKTKSILVGLHKWVGDSAPTDEDISNCEIIEQGQAHINTIGHIGGEIVGNKPLEDDGLKPLLQTEAGYLLDGFNNLGKLLSKEQNNYSKRVTYGLRVIKLLADKHFANNS